MPFTPPRLWIVATPLGNLGDFSPRAREVLSQADVILAEDTRRAARLCASSGLEVRRFVSFHDHNEAERQEDVLRLLREGKSVALISDAGTPLLADPGYRLVRACRQAGLPVSPIPGPSAPVTALSAAGIPPLPYTFLGFMPRDTAGRAKLFRDFAQIPGSLIFFERKDRLKESLAVASQILGPREVAVCRELTKIHEEFILFRLEHSQDLPDGLLGEITVVIGPPEVCERTPQSEVEVLIRNEKKRGEKPRETARRIQQIVQGWNTKEIYSLITDDTKA